MIRLLITVDDVNTIMAAGYTVVRVYSDASETGTFTTLEGTVTLVASTEGYEFVDTGGTTSTWYRVCYYGASPGESDKSAARKGGWYSAYATVTELRARQTIDDAIDDATLAMMLDGISRALDRECRRRFFTTASDETRYFTATQPDVLWPGDVVSVTTLATDDAGTRLYATSWAATDYDLEPFNASADGEPYTCIRTAPLGTRTFPTIGKGVKIVGKFGWPSVPDQVREATLLAAQRLWKRKDAPLGVMGSAELGMLKQILTEDPELLLLLEGVRNRHKLV